VIASIFSTFFLEKPDETESSGLAGILVGREKDVTDFTESFEFGTDVVFVGS